MADVDGITAPESPCPSATRPGELIFVSRQGSFDNTDAVTPDGIRTQTECSLTRLARALLAFDARLDDVVSATEYRAGVRLGGAFNTVWKDAFGDHRTSRALVVTELLDPALLVEVQAVALIPRARNGKRAALQAHSEAKQ